MMKKQPESEWKIIQDCIDLSMTWKECRALLKAKGWNSESLKRVHEEIKVLREAVSTEEMLDRLAPRLSKLSEVRHETVGPRPASLPQATEAQKPVPRVRMETDGTEARMPAPAPAGREGATP